MRAPWGQNFLVHTQTARRIVDALRPGPRDRVIEIGPGRGALTEPLVGRTASLTAVELDRALAARLAARWAGGATVVTADFLKWPLPEEEGWLLIGNLPYSAGNAILRRVLDWAGWERAVFMVQREVARRLTALPGGRDYGLLTLAREIKSEARTLFDVPPGAFRPVPKVTSSVVELKRRPHPLVENEAAFFRVARAAFEERRKTIRNSLSSRLGLAPADVEEILRNAGIASGSRPETLGWEAFDRIARSL